MTDSTAPGPQVDETELPGVGMRYDFTSETGQCIGVVHYRTGRRELVFYDPAEPDRAQRLMQLSDAEGRTLAELLGGARVAEQLTRIQRGIEGLAIDWLPLSAQNPFAEKTIGDTQARTRTGVSVVAVLRGQQTFPAPGPEFELNAQDTLVVVGTPEGIADLAEILKGGSGK